MLIKDAAAVWSSMRGLLCVFKPPEVGVSQIRHKIVTRLCSELNEMEGRPPDDFVEISPNHEVIVRTDLSDHPKVVGPRYLPEDVVLSWSNFLGFNTSGVLLFGLRSGTKYAKFIRENRPIRAYRLEGCLGKSTDTGFRTGKVVEKSRWRHVSQFHLDKLLATMQASHQKKMFELSGVDMQSEAAYNLAASGPIRPANSKLPLLYSIKCTHFAPPHFTLEIQCVNEYEAYLLALVQEVGFKLHSNAHCTALQCIRHSCFNLDHALLSKHWTLQFLYDNLRQNDEILKKNDYLITQTNANLIEQKT